MEILIESDNPSSNKTLNELLENFLIEMTHSGQSYYKYENKISQINMNYKSEKLLLKFQYGFKSKYNKNTAYEKLETNRPVLSPYTFWTIKISAIKEKEKEEIDFLNKIDSIMHENFELRFILFGHGIYVDESKNKCKNSDIVAKF